MLTTSAFVETERLILRRFRESDLQDLHEYLSDPDVVAFEPYKPQTMEEVRENHSTAMGEKHFRPCGFYRRALYSL